MGWQDAPVVSDTPAPPPAGAQPAWMAAPPAAPPAARVPAGRIPTGVPSVDTAPEPAPRPQPTLRDHVIGGIQGAMDTAQGVISGLGDLFGGAAGALGAAVGAVQTKLTGGVQPDSDAVRAVTGPPARGTPDALTEGAQQGARSVNGAIQSLGSVPALRQANPVTNLTDRYATPQSQDVAADVQEGAAGVLSRVDPGLVLPGAAAARTPAGAVPQAGGAIDQALNAGARGARAVAEAPGRVVRAVTEGGVARALGPADPELAAMADKAGTLPHPVQIPPDRIAAPGTGAQSTAQLLGELPASGGKAREKANIDAMTRNTADLMIPGTDKSRINGDFIRESMDHNGSIIGDGYTAAGPIPLAEIQDQLQAAVQAATDSGRQQAVELVSARVRQLASKADEAGNIDPTTIRQWESDVGKDIRAPGMPDEVSSMLAGLQNVTRDSIMDRLPPEQAQAVTDARRRYAYTVAFSGQVAKRGRGGSAVMLNGQVVPGKLIDVATSTHTGQSLLGQGRGGALEDLARIGQVIDSRAGEAPPSMLRRTTEATLGLAAGATAGRVYNKAAAGATKRMLDDARGPRPPAPPEPPTLELAPEGPLPSAPRGGGAPGPLGDLTPEWETLPGAGPARPGAATVDAAGLYPAVGEERAAVLPQGPGPGREIPAVPGRPGEPDAAPLGDLTPEWETLPGAGPARAAAVDAQGLTRAVDEPVPSTGSRRGDRLEIPAAPGRPDLPDTMVVNREGQVFADQPTKPDEVDVKPSIASLESPGARAARDAPPSPPPPPPAAPKKPKPGGLPPIQYQDAVEWRKAHGIGGDDEAARAIATRQAYDVDPDAVEAAAKKFDRNPKKFDAEVDKILERARNDANPSKPAAGGGQGAAGASGKSGGDAASGRDGAAGGERAAAPGPDGQGNPQVGSAEGAAEPVDEHAAAAERARFEIAHPRAADGTFTERAERNLMAEWRAAQAEFKDAMTRGDHAGAERAHQRMQQLGDEIQPKGK
jgi:hypothetical protein